MSQVPGVQTAKVATPRIVQWTSEGAMLIPGGKIVHGAVARDPLNTGDVDVLQAGLVMGRITASGLYAPAVIGTIGVAYDGSTQVSVLNTAEATELVRRQGAAATFNLTGPPTAGGVVRTLTATYSVVGTGTPANEVQTFTPDAAATAGTYRIKLQKADGTTVYTAALAAGATLAACQAAITLALGAVAGWVASSAGSAAPFSAGPIALVLTASGTGYTATDFPMCEIDIASGPLTGVTTMTSVETTKGIPAANTVTVTALAVDDIQTITFQAGADGGTFQLRYLDVATANLVFNVTTADMQTAVRALHADLAAAVVTTVGGVGVDYVITTPSRGLVSIETCSDAVTDGGVWEPVAIAHTQQGVDGRFITGSYVQPTDGSQTPRAILAESFGLKVTDENAANVDVQAAKLLIGGLIDASQVLNYPTDTALIAWGKAALRAVGGPWVFDDDF